MNRKESKSELEKLVRYFEQNIHQLKAPTFNEAQARQQLIDPFFEALGWDVRNKLMVPPYRLEVIPEGRVRSSLGKVLKDQAGLFDKSTALKEEQAEYASMLEYIAEDEFKADQKVATKKPDYRFRLQGSTKFFVEAKKPAAELINNVDAIFQVKRYGFSARVPVSILTDFEEFRVFDCTRKPFYDKPKVGVLKEFDLTYQAYLDEFERLYDAFSREAVVAGSIEALQKKYLEKRTGEFALDRSFLEDLSQWRVELAQDIAKHPKNRRILNTYTFNECVQRILDRIVFLRVCEDRNIEVERTLVELMRVWQDHPGISLYEKLNELIKQRRSLYNGLLFAEHECERLVVSNKILEKIFKNINYPLSPYHFDEIGVEILGSIYERFLGKTIRLTQKQVRVDDKPEVRKAGGVYYTPQYIVDYIVDNTVGKLLYEDGHVTLSGAKGPPSSDSKANPSVASLPQNDKNSEPTLKLSPKQVCKLKIIDIACGSGSFLLGAFQMLIDYHIEWYTHHPEDIKEVNGVRDAYEDPQGRLVLSARKKREILVNSIYGVDIDAQAVEVTQMSLYLKVLEDENDATLNKPTMLALHEVLLPPLKNNIKCGNSLIGTDIGAQGELFDNEAMRKINPFDWEVEFKEIIEVGGFDCAIGNPPYLLLQNAGFAGSVVHYFETRFVSAQYKVDLYHLFLEKGIRILKHQGRLGFITPNTYLKNKFNHKLRRFILDNTAIVQILLLPEKVFPEASVDTAISIFRRESNQKARIKNKGIVVNVRESLSDRSGYDEYYVAQEVFEKTVGNQFNVFQNLYESEWTSKIQDQSINLGEFADAYFGIQTFDRDKFVSGKKLNSHHKRIIDGEDVERYSMRTRHEFVNFIPEAIKSGGKAQVYEGQKIVVRQIGHFPIASIDDSGLYSLNTLYNIYLVKPYVDLKFVLAIINSQLIRRYWQLRFSDHKATFPKIKKEPLLNIPIRKVDLAKPSEKKLHDELVALVDKMLELHKQLNKGSFGSQKEPIQRQIAATDKKIDELVYKLYGLTEEEITIVEGE